MPRAGLALALLALMSCADERDTLTVRVRTDFIPGEDFSAAEVLISGERFFVDARSGEDWAANAPIVAALDVAPGMVQVLARLHYGRVVFRESEMTVEVRGPTDVTALFSRTCVDCLEDGGVPLEDASTVPDVGPSEDAGEADAGEADAGEQDAGEQDAGVEDAGQQDAAPDAATDAGVDAGPTPCASSSECAADEFCDRDSCPSRGDARVGECKARPEFCSPIQGTVCGCDGVIYPNECMAQGAGTTLSPDGSECPNSGSGPGSGI